MYPSNVKYKVPGYAKIRTCRTCGTTFREGEQMGKWQCRNHLRTPVVWSYVSKSSGGSERYLCCGLSNNAYANVFGQIINGCTLTDHEDKSQYSLHNESIQLFGVNVGRFPLFLHTQYDVPLPDPKSIITIITPTMIKSWIDGTGDRSYTAAFTMGDVRFDLEDISRSTATRAMEGPYTQAMLDQNNTWFISDGEDGVHVDGNEDGSDDEMDYDMLYNSVYRMDPFDSGTGKKKSENTMGMYTEVILYSKESRVFENHVKCVIESNLLSMNYSSLQEWRNDIPSRIRETYRIPTLV